MSVVNPSSDHHLDSRRPVSLRLQTVSQNAQVCQHDSIWRHEKVPRRFSHSIVSPSKAPAAILVSAWFAWSVAYCSEGKWRWRRRRSLMAGLRWCTLHALFVSRSRCYKTSLQVWRWLLTSSDTCDSLKTKRTVQTKFVMIFNFIQPGKTRRGSAGGPWTSLNFFLLLYKIIKNIINVQNLMLFVLYNIFWKAFLIQ